MTLSAPLAAAIGYVAGAFTPSIGRRIKAYFVKETQAAEKSVKNAVANTIKKA